MSYHFSYLKASRKISKKKKLERKENFKVRMKNDSELNVNANLIMPKTIEIKN